ncbi:hypothetical protein M422DRAFT_81945, partial [Sphaerobolus stellatus SS14]
LLGVTGSGKTSFISSVTGKDCGVGHTLQSCTARIKLFKSPNKENNNSRIILIDTPGFSRNDSSDIAVLKEIAHFLDKMQVHKGGVYVRGVLFFHRISDGDLHDKYLHLLEDICGNDFLKKVTIVTTMWDDI